MDLTAAADYGGLGPLSFMGYHWTLGLVQGGRAVNTKEITEKIS